MSLTSAVDLLSECLDASSECYAALRLITSFIGLCESVYYTLDKALECIIGLPGSEAIATPGSTNATGDSVISPTPR